MPISIRHVLPEETATVYRLIPEFAGLHDAQAIRQRIGERVACALVAYNGAEPVGFTLGYESAPCLCCFSATVTRLSGWKRRARWQTTGCCLKNH
ncbi:permease [Cronobacter sakazakii]|nr:permease [Cronobacter sakazakii]ELY4028733.1 permease [Cronobacter sakazakii]